MEYDNLNHSGKSGNFIDNEYGPLTATLIQASIRDSDGIDPEDFTEDHVGQSEVLKAYYVHLITQSIGDYGDSDTPEKVEKLIAKAEVQAQSYYESIKARGIDAGDDLDYFLQFSSFSKVEEYLEASGTPLKARIELRRWAMTLHELLGFRDTR